MCTKFKAWKSIEGFWFWSVLLFLVIIFTAPLIHMEWLLKPENGFWRLRVNPDIAFWHGGIAFCILLLMLCNGKVIKVLYQILCWVAVVTGFYTLWSVGVVITVIPLVWGGSRVGFAANRPTINVA